MDLSPKRSVIREVLISQDGKVDLGEIASAIAAFSPGRANNRHRQGTGCRPKALGISSGCFTAVSRRQSTTALEIPSERAKS
jgi:hypothetical protein